MSDNGWRLFSFLSFIFFIGAGIAVLILRQFSMDGFGIGLVIFIVIMTVIFWSAWSHA